MIVIFIARGSDEFDKYYRGMDSNGGSLVGWVPVVNEPVEGAKKTTYGRLKNERYDNLNKGQGNDDDKKAQKSVEYRIFKKPLEGNDRLHVIIVNSNETIATLKADIVKGKRPFSEESCRAFVKVLKQVLYSVLEKYGDEVCQDHEVHLFVHWKGGSNPKMFQNQFNTAIKEFRLASEFPCKRFISYAVSSRRPECFDVRRSQIIPPCTDAEVQELIDRFNRTEAWENVKNILLSISLELSVNEEDYLHLKKYLLRIRERHVQWRELVCRDGTWFEKVADKIVADEIKDEKWDNENMRAFCVKLLQGGDVLNG